MTGLERLAAYQAKPHHAGERVHFVFDRNREGVVIESSSRSTLIEFEDEEAGERYTHCKWLPTQHWKAARDRIA